jgi:hypothetical protein
VEIWKDSDVLQARFSNRDMVGLITIGATRIYYAREMLAAFIIFSALFASVAAIGLTLFLFWFLLSRASQLELGWMETHAKSFARVALRLLPARSRV